MRSKQYLVTSSIALIFSQSVLSAQSLCADATSIQTKEGSSFEEVPPSYHGFIPENPTIAILQAYFMHNYQGTTEQLHREFMAFMRQEVLPNPDFQNDPIDFILGIQSREAFENLNGRVLVSEFIRENFQPYSREKKSLAQFIAQVKIDYPPSPELHDARPKSVIQAERRDSILKKFQQALLKTDRGLKPIQMQIAMTTVERIFPDGYFIHKFPEYLKAWNHRMNDHPHQNEDVARAELAIYNLFSGLLWHLPDLQAIQAAQFSLPPDERVFSADWELNY